MEPHLGTEETPSSPAELPQGYLSPSQAHLIGFHVAWEEAASFDGLIASQVHSYHRLLMVLLAQLQNLKGPAWEQGPMCLIKQ